MWQQNRVVLRLVEGADGLVGQPRLREQITTGQLEVTELEVLVPAVLLVGVVARRHEWSSRGSPGREV